jgi:hypothetical protein
MDDTLFILKCRQPNLERLSGDGTPGHHKMHGLTCRRIRLNQGIDPRLHRGGDQHVQYGDFIGQGLSWHGSSDKLVGQEIATILMIELLVEAGLELPEIEERPSGIVTPQLDQIWELLDKENGGGG